MMKTMEERIPHGEPGHFCQGGCPGYADGGEVSQDAKDLADIAASGFPLAADPQMIDAGLRAGAPSEDKGWMVLPESVREEGPGPEDPSEIPEHIREFIEQSHKDRRESRPDEAWRIAPAGRSNDIAPYKKDEEDRRTDVADELRGLSSGGPVPGYDDGGQVPDPNALLSQLEAPGAGLIAPSIAAVPKPPMPSGAGSPAMEGETELPGPAPAAVPPVKPAALTDQDFMDRANKMLGLNPSEQAGFMKMLGGNAQKAQLGSALAGIGDAIASGGTLGRVNPGALNKSEELIQGRTNEGLQGLQSIRENQGKTLEVADKLESRDPQSPLSKWAQKAYGPVGKKIGLNLDNASAALIGDVTGKGVEALNTEYQNQLKMMGLDLQKKQVEATIGNQKAEREIAEEGKRLEATKALAARGPLDKVAGMIPGTTSHEVKKTLENAMTGQKGPVPANSRAEYDALPSGTHYIDSFGTEKIKK